jgi:acetyl-CoA decarbonylase/synthase complex subunit gamma
MTLGLVMALILVFMGLIPIALTAGHLETAGWFLLIPAVSAFTAMNFTGSTTYTSLSGVKLEMRYAMPAQIAAGVIGSGFWLAARFF